MKAVPKKKLWRCRYHCSDYRGVLIFVALAIPVIALLLGWIDGTGLKNLPLQVTIGGVLFILLLVVFMCFSFFVFIFLPAEAGLETGVRCFFIIA